jgi:hypothetical protein
MARPAAREAVVGSDPGPLLDHAARERRPQPVGPAGVEADLAVQVQIHGIILVLGQAVRQCFRKHLDDGILGR